MRQEMKKMGCVFLDWSNLIKAKGKNVTPELLNAFKTISEKGFLVFENGCILPHPYYSKKGKEGPARFRGSKVSSLIFNGPLPKAPEERNEDGWPMTPEITHLCHWPACMNPEHLVVEPRWKNWKRLYCFGCDCGVKPPCIGKYHPGSYWQDRKNWPKQVGYGDMKKLKEVLPALIRVLPLSHFDKEDKKIANRLLRLKRAKKHKRQAKKKLKNK